MSLCFIIILGSIFKPWTKTIKCLRSSLSVVRVPVRPTYQLDISEINTTMHKKVQSGLNSYQKSYKSEIKTSKSPFGIPQANKDTNH